MSRDNQQSMKEAIQMLLKTYRLDTKLNQVKLLDSWEKVMGKSVAKRTRDIYFRDGKLFIHLESSALREELQYSKEKMIKLLNEEVGAEVVKEVILK